tara:strand:+ start:56 stop:793 length:738 start_codon:yes stop_codon:yes gene_type:complete
MATEQIPTTLIADDAVTNAKIGADAVSTTEIANDASISTSGNIATTGSGTLTVAGASNFGSIASGTLGSSVKLPQGAIANVHCSTSDITPYTPASNFTTVAGGSSVSYTPTTGARFVVYQYTTTWDNEDSRSIISFKFQLDGENFIRTLAGWDDGNTPGSAGSGTISMRVALSLSSITTDFSGHSGGHNWQTNAGGTSAFSAGTLRITPASHGTSQEATLCRLANAGNGESSVITRPTTLIYSVM